MFIERPWGKTLARQFMKMVNPAKLKHIQSTTKRQFYMHLRKRNSPIPDAEQHFDCQCMHTTPLHLSPWNRFEKSSEWFLFRYSWLGVSLCVKLLISQLRLNHCIYMAAGELLLSGLH